jgi:hypothetical protein
MSTRIPSQAPSPASSAAADSDGPPAQTYTPVPGDTASVLALRFYGDASRWSELRALNPDKVTIQGHIKAGVPLIIRNGTGNPSTHTPLPGDTLGALALRFLGDSKRWTEIRDANPGKVGDNGEIRAGVALSISNTGPKHKGQIGGAPAPQPPTNLTATVDDPAPVDSSAGQVKTGFDDGAAAAAPGAVPVAPADVPTGSPPASQIFTAKPAPAPVNPKDIDPKTRKGLTALGLTVKDLVNNPAAAPAFKEAAQKAADGDYLGALDVLADASAAASAPKPLSVSMKTAAAKLPDGLVKTLLTDPAVIDQLATNRRLQASIAKVLLPERRMEGIRELIGNDLIRNAVLSDVGNDPAVSSALGKIGLSSKDLVDAGRAAPGLWDAVSFASAGKYKEALTALQGAIQSAPQLAATLAQKFVAKMPPALRDQFQQFGITADDLRAAAPVLPQIYDAVDAGAKGDGKRLLTDLGAATLAAAPITQKILSTYAQKLPAGVAKSVLTDPAVIQSLTTDPTLYQAVGKLLDPATRMDGLRLLVSNAGARDATLNALGNDPTVKAELAKVGLEPADLVSAGAVAPTLLDAAQCFTDKKYAAGLADIRQAVAAGSPVATKVLSKLASNLPDGLAKTVLTNPAFINEWLTDTAAQDAVAKLFDEKTRAEGAKALLANPNVQKVTFDAVTSDPGVQKRLAQIGLTAEDLRAAGPALPQIMQAVQDASDKKWSAFFTDLKGVASSAAPVVTKLVAKVGGTLPNGLAKTLLTNQAFVQQWLTDADAQTAVSQLFDDKTRMQGVKALLNDAPARDATLKALASDPQITADLAKVGMTPGDLVEAGAASPSLLNAVTQASAGDFRGAFASVTDAMKAAPSLSRKVAQKFFKALPPATQQQLTAAGVTSDDFAQSAAALPQIGNALQDFAGKKYPAMLQDLRAAASAGAPLVGKLLSQLASNLPDGVAKSVLANPAFINVWLTNTAVQDAVAKLFDEKTRLQGTKDLLSNPDLQKATFDAITSDKGVQAKLAAIGLTPDDLRSAGPAAPLLYQASLDAGNKQWGAALNDVRQAASGAAPLVAKVVGKLSANLPDGLAKTLLGNQAFVQQWLTDTAAQDGIAKLFAPATRMDGIRALLGDAALRTVALDAISSDAGVQKQLAKVGLTADDLKQAGAAAPSLWSAAEQLSQGQWKEGLQSLADAYKAAPDLAKKIGNRVIDALPPEIKAKLQGGSGLGLTADDMASAQAALPALLDAQQHFAKNEWKEGLHSLASAEVTAAPVVQKALAAAAQKLPAGIAKTLLTNPDVLKELTADKALYDSIGKLFDPATRMAGISELIHNDGARQSVLTALASDPTVKADLDKAGLTPDMLVQAGAASPHVFDAAVAAKAGDWNGALQQLEAAADAAPAVLGKLSQTIYDRLPPEVRNSLQALGLNRDDLGQAANAMPHLVAAAQDLGKGQSKEALAELGQAAEAAPQIVAKAVKAAASKLPDGFSKALLSDPAVITALVKDPALHGAFKQMASGTSAGIEAGLRALAGNSAAMSAVGNALWNDPVSKADLQKLGFQSADDIAKAGASLADVIQLRDDIANKNWKGALQDLDALWKGLPDGVKTKAISALCDELKLPKGIAILILQGGEVFHDPAVREKLGVAIDALKKKDTRGFVAALADTAEVINTNHPDQAVAFLDALGTLPGGLGRFYSNHELNDALVRSGARNIAWEAVKAMAEGDNHAAVLALGKASEALLSYGSPVTDQIRAKHPHEAGELDKIESRLHIKIGDKGLQATALVFKQFWDTLPPDLRQQIIDQSEQIAAHAAGHVVPGGSLIEIPGDAMSLEHALKPKNGAAKDHIDILLRSAKLGADVAGAVPAINEVAGPLNTAIAVAEVAKTGFDIYKNVEALKQQFAFGQDPTATGN